MSWIKAIPVFLFLSILLAIILPISTSASVFLSKDHYTIAEGDTIDDDIYLAASEGLFHGVVTGGALDDVLVDHPDGLCGHSHIK